MQTNNKLREALEMMNTLFEQGAICTSSANSAEEMEQIEELYRKTKAVLTEPVRNCDVGTAEEQTRRMEAEYCHIQKSCYESPSGRECPLHKAGADCRLIWAQMPYKEGGAK